MPLSVMSAIMLLIAHLSGFLCDTDRCKGSNRVIACAFIILILLLKRFEFAFSPELTLSASAVLFVLTATVSYTLVKEGRTHTSFIIALSFVLSLAFFAISAFLHADALLLACGFISACANVALKGKGRSMLLVCALSPLLLETEKTLVQFLSTGYCYFTLASNSLDLMMICSLFCGFTHGIVNWSTDRAAARESIA